MDTESLYTKKEVGFPFFYIKRFQVNVISERES